MYKLDRLLQADPSRNFSWTHYPRHLMDGHGDDGVEEEEDEVVLLPAASMDATALAHATSSRFIRFSSPQIDGSTTVHARSISAARTTVAAAAQAETSPSPPTPGNGRATPAPKSMAAAAATIGVVCISGEAKARVW